MYSKAWSLGPAFGYSSMIRSESGYRVTSMSFGVQVFVSYPTETRKIIACANLGGSAGAGKTRIVLVALNFRSMFTFSFCLAILQDNESTIVTHANIDP